MPFQVCEPLYTSVYNSPRKKVVLQGGTSSAKTYTTLQILAMIGATQPGTVITIVAQDVPNLKKGAIRDMAKVMASSVYLQNQLEDYKNTKGYNKTDRIYHYKNGSVIEFNSYDDEQDARGGRRDYLFINECNGISYDIYFQLNIRTKRKVFLDYNPSSKFWVHEKLLGEKDVELFITDHRHNRFLTPEQHAEIEGIPDKELWKVYARGMTGTIHGLIYPNYKIIDFMPDIYPKVMGLDFGWNHQTALIEVAYDKASNNLFWDELIYQNEITIGDLLGMMKELNIGKTPIYADHAAADKIEDLKRAKFNVHKADKDVKNGIDFVKRNNLYITKRSVGIRKEIMIYKWKVRTKDDVTLDEPVKFKDDAMDGGRYGSYTGFRKPKGMIVAQQEGEYDDILGAA